MNTVRCTICLLLLLLVTACGAPEPAAPAAESNQEEAHLEDDHDHEEEAHSEEEGHDHHDEAHGDVDGLKKEALETYANIVFASYEDSLALAVELQSALNAFVENPSEETHQAAQTAWLASNEPYGQTEAYRFYGGPIDDDDGLEGLLNAWPLDEAYVDYIEEDATVGIINNTADYPEITADLLTSLNEVGAEENISTGYHAIEFLLWGQDRYEDSAGQRSYTDYVAEGDNAEIATRRAQYLIIASDLLVEHLTDLTNDWDPSGPDNYRATFLEMPADDALQMVLTGLGVLSKSELAGERMFTAYDNQDQEDEHSCFSDNTHRDIITNNQGIVNVYRGSYTRLDGSTVSGTSLADVVAAIDSDLNDQMQALMDQSMSQTEAIHVPFDQAIVLADHRPQVLEAVMTLQDQGDKIAEVASALGLTINTALPE